MAAVDYFLKIEGIQGESRDAKHKDEIELESFVWGETTEVVHSGGGGSSGGKVHAEDLHVVMRVSKASPLLFLACASGQHFKEAVLTVRKAGGGHQEFLVFRLSRVLVTAYHVGGDTSEVPADQVSLGFAQIRVEYHPQKPDGSLDTPVTAGWDVEANKKL